MYKLLRPILFQIPPETMHDAAARVSSFFSPVAGIFSGLFSYEHPSLETQVFGVKFKNPVGLAPGYDKSGSFARFMAALGFSFIEIGTVTPEPQAGNPKPRLFRIDKDDAVINRMGFNSIGMKAVAENLKKLQHRSFVVGINLGKNKTTSNEQAAEDYLTGYNGLALFADYVVVNVSSPNTPGLRQLLEKEPLKKILNALPRSKPLLLKISPDMDNAQLDEIAEVALETKIDGIIATNTIATPEGGLSGEPLRRRSTEVINHMYKKLNGQLPIIGVGGIFSAEDAYEKIRAGASLVQIYTGMIYEGPGLVKRIKKGLVELLRRDGFMNISEAVGVSAK
ncbi:MAG: dihydroorotate dehydrogenase (quinone) [Candidatus Doudnabacteria bacterium RIFCSPHIGHO2_02_FULL_48_21]|uniref:Dihydroorotate dehydrogenase (quinone) n=1 Tax=Candidatus Doudnabacteria bacterium RIFCSPLOWO2_02_FULL_48_13 TaxID=1817845 RepID=A0A1F5Q9H3_9BACT|nr:MAG: dihydroorotate dehydrogenase (quinone) [Candidatus Doudnabacteria bacterium RIFCSPHIGHO2_01_48_18]OGE79838.1 MAG: dihydroorotate dehydrogenase (quinone) [Candidatus Doudnabacteria bacterium RIFCSPHIGHO2_01_FULL_48_180]OGE91377.1 MAG: dihydroorotate dehydrogenase (quinone) [Candidatus Doudnabacteria bacterium RIFCSPHIGHO2_12_FULL_47_25]OGE93189.1 MAG: dihydroorotate dehydrogenase (quinone) [Candidatus Doudnabacteria bacterium RIFCSPHIGHO2_02_FULL_48_21]OGE96710.1 MAG: dihydroorotate dehy